MLVRKRHQLILWHSAFAETGVVGVRLFREQFKLFLERGAGGQGLGFHLRLQYTTGG